MAGKTRHFFGFRNKQQSVGRVQTRPEAAEDARREREYHAEKRRQRQQRLRARIFAQQEKLNKRAKEKSALLQEDIRILEAKLRGLPFVKRGYQYVKRDWPRNSKRWYTKRCVLVMERSLGRRLQKDESIVHRDGNTMNDALENLQLVTRIPSAPRPSDEQS